MTLNNLKLTSQIIDKFALQVVPMSDLRIESQDIFSDRTIIISNHALKRLNARLGIEKEAVEYAQFIRSKIYGQNKTFVTYKSQEIFISDVSFGEVDMTLVFTKKDENYYVLVTAYINSTERFVEFMTKQYKSEKKEHEIERILKDSMFGGISSEEFFKNFEKEHHLSKKQVEQPVKEMNKVQKHEKPVAKQEERKRHNKPVAKHVANKEIHSQKLNDKFMDALVEELGLPEIAPKEKPIKRNKPVAKYVVNKEIHNQKLDSEFADSLIDDMDLPEIVVEEKPVIRNKSKQNKANPKEGSKIFQQTYDDDYMESLLNDNTLVQQSVEDIVIVETPMIDENPVIREDDRETKVPEQKEIHARELNEDLMNELLGDFGN